MSDEYKRVAMSEENCPEREKFLEELQKRKGREPFTWREVLSTPMEHQSKAPYAKPRKRSRKDV